ncbi:hypothetical protein KAR48_17925 [bacterium]|nr:hypothetical protein [bacterium]
MNTKVKFYFLVIILLIHCLPAVGQINGNFRENQAKAFAASSADECQSSLKFCKEVLKVVPNHPLINYLTARLNAILGNEKIALEQLNKATELGYTTKLPFNKTHHLNDTAFITLREKEGFKQIMKALEKAEKPIHKSQIAFSIKDKKLGTEGITYDPVEKMFYLGSHYKHKIIKVDHFGNSIDFTEEGQDGLKLVLGIHVDPIRRTLWACSFSEEKKEIFKYDLSSGRLIKKYSFPPNEVRHGFNDLVIHPNGDIYISGGGAIYVIPHLSDKLEWFFKNELIVSPNGITLSEDGQVIYSADYLLGINKIDIRTKSVMFLSENQGHSTFGIDGLYFFNNSLYAVQIGLNQISRFSLNKDATSLKDCEVFERYTPELIEPTTGVIVDDYFYYVTDDGGQGEHPRGIFVMKVAI